MDIEEDIDAGVIVHGRMRMCYPLLSFRVNEVWELPLLLLHYIQVPSKSPHSTDCCCERIGESILVWIDYCSLK